MSVIVDGSTIVLTGTVDDGCWFWGDGFSAPDVIRALAQVGDGNDVTIRLNSGGGLATEGSAIHAALRRHKGRKTVIVEGCAASAATQIVMAGDERIMTPGSVLMVHDPSNITFGTIADHERTIGELNAVANSIAGLYAEASGQTPEQARADMLAETWMTPEEAVAKGYATAVGTAEIAPAGAVIEVRPVPLESANDDELVEAAPPPAAFAYAQYRHTPERIRAMASAEGWNRPPLQKPKAQQQQPAPPAEPRAPLAPEPPRDNVVALDAARAQGRSGALAYAREVTDLCQLAGQPEKATAFIEAETSVDQVRKALLDARADAESATTITGHHAGSPQPTSQAGGLAQRMRRLVPGLKES